MPPSETTTTIVKIPTHIAGFDDIGDGGLPARRTTLVAGTAGSGKTVFAGQFLAQGIVHGDEAGVFISFEEDAQAIRDNLSGFGWPVEAWERAGKWAFLDVAPFIERAIVGEFDLDGLVARVQAAIQRLSAKRVAIDALDSLFVHLDQPDMIRAGLRRMGVAMKQLGVTAVMTAERTSDHGAISRHGFEEFVCDNVVVLRNALEGEQRRRTLEILKYRGTGHRKGQFPFSILDREGIVIIPSSAVGLEQQASTERVSCGLEKLDEMCGGGLFRCSVSLVSGATGTGKTLLGSHFLSGCRAEGERALLLALEESRSQIVRDAEAWGIPFEALEQSGSLRIVCLHPEGASLEDHLLEIRRQLDEYRPTRVVLDSLSAIERAASERSFREFVITFNALLKSRGITGMLTSDTPSLLGGASLTEKHISSFTDTIFALRYSEVFGTMKRCLTVLKMRGSRHDTDIYEFTIGDQGMQVGRPFRHVSGILTGNPRYHAPGELTGFVPSDRPEPAP